MSAVYGLVAWWAAEGRETDRARRALRLQRLKVSDREDPFAAVIRCTADPAKADKRTRSKWSRVMRCAKFRDFPLLRLPGVIIVLIIDVSQRRSARLNDEVCVMRRCSEFLSKGSAICLFLLLLLAVRAVAADTCILIDTDADLDDYRAIAALASGKQIIRAIVVTEGVSRRAEGAVAMQDFLRRSELTIPVLLGVAPDPYREYEERKGLLDWRKIAESLNGVLNSVGISSPAESDVAIAIRPYINDCSKITLLMIGPWTSFMRYATAILPRIDRIVAQGRPYPDEIGGEPDGFNCVYDKQSCFAAFDLLVGRQLRGGRRLRTTWVDIPNNADVCGLAEPGIDESGQRKFAFAPNVAWLESLRNGGGRARVIAEILQNKVESWDKTSLWDDLTALYILRPELFGVRGGHLEPCIPAHSVRDLLKDFMSKG